MTLVTVTVKPHQYIMSHMHMARCWGRSQPESLRWFAESLGQAKPAPAELPRVTTPLTRTTRQAEPRLGVFGQRLCDCCRSSLASGEFECTFASKVQHRDLCFGCASSAAYQKWNGHFSPKLLAARLVRTYDRDSKAFEVKHVTLPYDKYMLALRALSDLEIRCRSA